ncbi:hypothetical protein Xen7305DRAFT_00010090 [Xenococcus sp. PCC 7305]|uniref:DUF4870 domain-containing protein n=1 Tax=Xenococcus sp. PCC 7305 TaxID=102125 RepID=UPI0002ABBFCC|nr:DUF4870 domain-containing protein [Xenococcus sp. PCC 7305]ELS01306.1 hypothetical protein Xen7305DRAFT_00010090 [Xenococcus sp. PCC 7305]
MTANSSDKIKLLSAASHGSIFISATVIAVGIPIAILMISDDYIVKENAREAINFHFNVWLGGIIIGVLSFITLGLLGLILAPIWFIYTWVLSIWAIIFCLKNTEKPFRYPFVFRLL